MAFDFVPRGSIQVPEIELADQVSLDAAQSALLIVDMQNDFVKPDGALVTPAASETVPRISELLTKARESGLHIVYTQDSQVENDPEFEVWPQHCRMGTWGWELIEELAPRPEDLVCRKNRYDGFYGTWLEHFLSHVWGVRNVIVVGTVANICVLHTAASAGLRYYHVVMPADGVSALTPFDQALTLRQVSWLYKGTVVRTTSDIEFET